MESTDGNCDAAIEEALRLYGARATENLSLNNLTDSRSKARVLGRKLMEHGDTRAYALGRRLVAMGMDQHNGAD